MPADSPLSSSPTSSPLSSTPTLSIGRAAGRNSLRSVLSSDTLSTHPLLASPTDSGAPNGVSSSPSAGTYAVYSGRKKPSALDPVPQPDPSPTSSSLLHPGATPPALHQRASPTSPTSATHLPPLISRPSSSPLPSTISRPAARSVSEAKELLRGQNLKAEVQSLGLANESAGWAMVQKLASLGKENEWSGVLAALGSGKLVLLLPAEKLGSSVLSPAFFLDHLALLETPVASMSSAPLSSTRGFATLSGFRGTLDSDTLVITSCGTALPEGTKLNFADPELHQTLAGAAHPSSSISTSSSATYPTTTLLSPITELSVPRAPSRSSTSSPPPAERKPSTIGRASGSTGSRLAALFAKAPPPEEMSDVSDLESTAVVEAPATPSSEPSSLFPSFTRSSQPNLDIVVLAINKVVRHGDFVKAIGKTLDSQLRETLKGIEGCEGEGGVIDRVCVFAARFQPPPTWTSSLPPSGRSTQADSYYAKEVEELSDAFQDLVHAVRLDLTGNIRTASARDKRRAQDAPAGEKEVEEEDLGMLEARVDASLERIEELVTTALYDRLFSPASSNDSQLNENLSSRIAALNILELSLEHLGLDLGGDGGPDGWDESSRTIRDSLEDVIGVAGKELARLQDSQIRSPRAKLDVFVNLHKIIVENLSRLPPIPLKEPKPDDASSSSRTSNEVEMDDASLRSRPSSRAISPIPPPRHSESSDEEALLRTPRPPSIADASQPIPEIQLPASITSSVNSRSSSPSRELTSSVHDATSSSVFDTTPRRSSTKPSSSSADLILPLLIYLVVEFNPRHLTSHLLFVQRFRSDSLLRGEGSYCSTSIHAVIEFLNQVDISALGLSSHKVAGMVDFPSSNGSSGSSRPTSIKGRVSTVTHELDRFVDDANSAIVKTLDSSLRMLFGPKGLAPKTIEDVRNVLDGAGTAASKARGSLLRRGSSPAGDTTEGAQREMVDIVVPGEVVPEATAATADKDDDARSVRSISSILRESSVGKGFVDKREGAEERPSIGDRLASIPGLGRFGTEGKTASGASSPAKTSLFAAFNSNSIPNARRATINVAPLPTPTAAPLPSSSSSSFFSTVRPVQRFMECEAGDLRIGEVGELLLEYRRLAEALQRQEGTL